MITTKLIHIIWIGDEIPSYATDNYRRWRELNPQWDVKLWSEQELKETFPTHAKRLPEEAHPAMKGNSYRFFLLWKFGGLYVDADCIPLKPIHNLCDQVGNWIAMEGEGRALTNAVMFFERPGHPFVRHCLDHIAGYPTAAWLDRTRAAEVSGPKHLTNWFYELENHKRLCLDISLLSVRRSMCWAWWEEEEEKHERPVEAFIHHDFKASWQ